MRHGSAIIAADNRPARPPLKPISTLPHPWRILLATAFVALAGCALRPAWHWDKPGAVAGEYDADVKFCKAQTYAWATDGMVTGESVRRMHACMEGRGWRKVEN
jgi:hypothetical protein